MSANQTQAEILDFDRSKLLTFEIEDDFSPEAAKLQFRKTLFILETRLAAARHKSLKKAAKRFLSKNGGTFLDNGKLPISMIGIRVVGNNILAEPIPAPEKSDGGIIMVKAQAEPVSDYRVIATGCGWRTRKGVLVQFDFKPGDVIRAATHGGDTIRLNNRTMKILKNHEVLAVITQ